MQNRDVKIGLIVAMQKELDLLLEQIKDPVVTDVNGYKFYRGNIGGHEAVAMTCGIGKVNAAIGTMTMIDNFRPDVIINSGVAGGTGKGASILDVVLAESIAYHDVWCGPGTDWGQAAGCPKAFECPTDARTLADKLGVKCGLVASGDIFVSREEDIAHILGLYPDAMAVDMESGAIAQVCMMRGVPMYCLRVVSDTPGASDNISQYENFWTDAPKSTFRAINNLIESL